MTPEDEEFNRVEMESRIKQEYIRAMRKTTREEKISRPAVYEVPANNRMKQPSREQLMAEVAVLTELVRVLSDRVKELEKTEQEPVAYINIEERKLEWAYKYMSWDTPTVVNLPKIPLYTTPPQRTWVELIRGIRVDGETVVISVSGGNDNARLLCGELLQEKEK